MEKNNLNSAFTEFSQWSENGNSIWLVSIIHLRRNIEKFNFPGKLDLERRKQVVWLTSREISALQGMEIPSLMKAEECTPLEKEFLVEHTMTDESYLQAHQGEAFVLDRKGEYLFSVNIKDHLHMYAIDFKGELESNWTKLVKLEMQLGKSLAYSYSSKFGFLTADPFICGTALLISSYLQLSGLIHSKRLPEVLSKLQDDAITIGSLQGDPAEPIGDLIKISNNYTLGINEETIISILRNFITKLIVEEHSARAYIRQQDSADIKDKVSRAFGLLIHSYQIEAAEALNEIALLKLGLELGWVKGTTMNELNQLFFNCRRAHLLTHFPEKVAHEEVSHKRAEFIHKTLKNVALTI